MQSWHQPNSEQIGQLSGQSSSFLQFDLNKPAPLSDALWRDGPEELIQNQCPFLTKNSMEHDYDLHNKHLCPKRKVRQMSAPETERKAFLPWQPFRPNLLSATDTPRRVSVHFHSSKGDIHLYPSVREPVKVKMSALYKICPAKFSQLS